MFNTSSVCGVHGGQSSIMTLEPIPARCFAPANNSQPSYSSCPCCPPISAVHCPLAALACVSLPSPGHPHLVLRQQQRQPGRLPQ